MEWRSINIGWGLFLWDVGYCVMGLLYYVVYYGLLGFHRKKQVNMGWVSLLSDWDGLLWNGVGYNKIMEGYYRILAYYVIIVGYYGMGQVIL